MEYGIYGIIDTETEELSGTLLTLRHEVEAVRIFGQLIGNPKTAPGSFPRSHILVRLGYVNAEYKQGSLIGRESLRNDYQQIMRGSDVLAMQEAAAAAEA